MTIRETQPAPTPEDVLRATLLAYPPAAHEWPAIRKMVDDEEARTRRTRGGNDGGRSGAGSRSRTDAGSRADGSAAPENPVEPPRGRWELAI